MSEEHYKEILWKLNSLEKEVRALRFRFIELYYIGIDDV